MVSTGKQESERETETWFIYFISNELPDFMAPALQHISTPRTIYHSYFLSVIGLYTCIEHSFILSVPSSIQPAYAFTFQNWINLLGPSCIRLPSVWLMLRSLRKIVINHTSSWDWLNHLTAMDWLLLDCWDVTIRILKTLLFSDAAFCVMRLVW